MTVILELPAWYVDEVLFDDLALPGGASYFAILNRTPDPGETEVRLGSSVSFDLATHAADAPSSTTLQVWIAAGGGPEVLVYDGGAGGFQAGYTGPESAVTNPDADTLRVVVDPLADFESLAVVVVRVAAVSGSGQILADSWTFTAQDLTPPRLLTAKSRELKRIRLTFNEPVDRGSGSDSALWPANYLIERVTVPAVDVVVASVEEVTSTVVDLILDTEATQGATYRVTVTGVEDLRDNVILAPYNVAEFVGFMCAVPDGRSFDLWGMIPQINRDLDPGDLENFTACLQEVTDLLLCYIDRWTDIVDPDIAPEIFLDAMLQDLGNPFTFDLSENDKRRLIRVLVSAYRQKGTAIGIINLVRFFLGVEVTINAYSAEGWILGDDELGESTILGPGTVFALYSFEVVSPIPLTTEQRDRIKEIADYMKPAHTHCIRIVEPTIPEVIDHLELGLSRLGETWILH